MSTTLQERPARLASGVCERLAPPPPEKFLSTSLVSRYALAMAIALYLVFCHGCHRDEDNELFIRLGLQAPPVPAAHQPTALPVD